MKWFLLFFPLIAYGQIKLDFSLEYKKSIDETLNLTSELHKSVKTLNGQEVLLEMKNGLKIIIKASHSEDVSNKLIEIDTTITKKKENSVMKIGKFHHIALDGETIKVKLRDKDDFLVDMQLTPQLERYDETH